jgi:hypothetical protein
MERGEADPPKPKLAKSDETVLSIIEKTKRHRSVFAVEI